jgi:hypothetical protein
MAARGRLWTILPGSLVLKGEGTNKKERFKRGVRCKCVFSGAAGPNMKDKTGLERGFLHTVCI